MHYSVTVSKWRSTKTEINPQQGDYVSKSVAWRLPRLWLYVEGGTERVGLALSRSRDVGHLLHRETCNKMGNLVDKKSPGDASFNRGLRWRHSNFCCWTNSRFAILFTISVVSRFVLQQLSTMTDHCLPTSYLQFLDRWQTSAAKAALPVPPCTSTSRVHYTLKLWNNFSTDLRFSNTTMHLFQVCSLAYQ